MKRRDRTKPVRSGKPAITSKSHLSAGDVQESSGGLNESQNHTTGQSLSDAFNPALRVTIEEIDISAIQPFLLVPDYTSNTESLMPIVAASAASVHCLDGWELIENEISEGNDKIRCLVYHLRQGSDLEIAIQKVAIRTMPQGGTCSYAELVRNAGILFNMFLASSENPVVFSHGGSRRGATYIQNTENNIRTLLANRLGKSPVTINKYLNHGEFINDETMQELINADVEKGFFEINQVQKRRLIDRLNAARIPDDNITDTVSQLVLSLLNDYRQPEPVEISGGQSNLEEASAVENQPEQAEASRSNPRVEEFKHWSGYENGETDAPAKEEEISQKIKMVGSLLTETADNTELTIQQRVETYTLQNLELSRLIQGLIHLMNGNIVKREDED